MTGFDKATFCIHKHWIKADKITSPNLQFCHVLSVMDHLIQTHLHMLLLALQGSGIILHMNGRGSGQNRSRIGFSGPGVHLTVHTLDTFHGKSANRN